MTLASGCLATVRALALSFSLVAPVAAEEMKSVAVTAIVEDPALDATRDGVKAALEQAGFQEDENLEWQYQNAQGNAGKAAQIARKFIGHGSEIG